MKKYLFMLVAVFAMSTAAFAQKGRKVLPVLAYRELMMIGMVSLVLA